MKLIKKISIKNLLILTLCLNTGSCASNEIEGVHPAFDDYVDDFEKILPKYSEDVRRLRIGFVDFPRVKDEAYTIGRCNLSITFNHTVTIDNTYWKGSTPTGKYFTMLHEFGHCVCYMSHTEPTSGLMGKLEEFLFKIGLWVKKGYLEDGCPASIMHPSDFGEECAVRHFNYYIKEFKQSCEQRRSNVK